AIYSTFLQRAYDQLIHDVVLQNLPVVFAIDRGGLVGADGPTHHGSFDFTYLRCLPNTTVMAPADENECRRMLTTAFTLDTPAAPAVRSRKSWRRRASPCRCCISGCRTSSSTTAILRCSSSTAGSMRRESQRRLLRASALCTATSSRRRSWSTSPSRRRSPRILDQLCRFALEIVAARQQTRLVAGNKRVAPKPRQPIVDLLASFFACHPKRRIDAPQIERTRIAAQRLAAALVEVFVEIRHRELAQAAVHRIAIAQLRAVVL